MALSVKSINSVESETSIVNRLKNGRGSLKIV